MEKRKKVLFTLFIILLILIAFSISLQKFADTKTDIKAKIGQNTGSSSLTINEYVLLSERTIGVYLRYLRENKLEEAYSLLSTEYREVITLESFKESIAQLDFSSYQVKSIVRKTENMYVASVEMVDGDYEMLIIMSDDRFSIVPEPFLKYFYVEKEISKDDVKYTLIGYQVNVNSCIFDVKITNHKKKDVHISGSDIKLESGYTIYAEGTNNAEFVVPAGEEKDIAIYFQTSLDFPVEFEIDRDDDEKVRMYKFKLD